MEVLLCRPNYAFTREQGNKPLKIIREVGWWYVCPNKCSDFHVWGCYIREKCEKLFNEGYSEHLHT